VAPPVGPREDVARNVASAVRDDLDLPGHRKPTQHEKLTCLGGKYARNVVIFEISAIDSM